MGSRVRLGTVRTFSVFLPSSFAGNFSWDIFHFSEGVGVWCLLKFAFLLSTCLAHLVNGLAIIPRYFFFAVAFFAMSFLSPLVFVFVTVWPQHIVTIMRYHSIRLATGPNVAVSVRGLG